MDVAIEELLQMMEVSIGNTTNDPSLYTSFPLSIYRKMHEAAVQSKNKPLPAQFHDGYEKFLRCPLAVTKHDFSFSFQL